MSDDDISELILRASAYLDGELDAGEMARAEASPAVMAEVEQLRSLRAGLRDVDPPSPDARERAIAAALAEFDAIRPVGVQAAPAITTGAATVVPFRPRPAYGRWLAVAAACVGVGLLGVVVVNGVGGGDQDDAASGQLDSAAADGFDDSATARAEASIFSDSATAEATSDSAAAAEMAAATAAPAASGAATDADSTSATTTAPTDLAVAAPSTTIVFDPEVALVDVGQLMSAGFQLAALDRAGTLTTPETACDIGQFEALSSGLYDDGTGQHSVVIAIDPATNQVGAFDDATCELVAFTPLP